MRLGKFQKAGLVLVLALLAGMANATPIVRTFTDGDNGGIITFTDLGSNKLQIDFDNTTNATNVGPGTNKNSSVITGLVFDILDDINAMTVDSFVDGSGNNLIPRWTVALNVNNNITPGNTKVDLAIKTSNGINGGIYNSADPGTNMDNVVADVATLVLTITDPDPWALQPSGISSDILRMQRVGANDGSLKISGTPVPEPGTIALLSGGLLGMGLIRRRRRIY